VAVRLPPFWAQRAVWVAQAEAQFTLAGSSSEQTKFCHDISQLDHRYATEVEDIITSPPERDRYSSLRTQVVRQLSPKREPHQSAPYARGHGRQQDVPVSQTPQEPRPRRGRQLSPQHLVQPASSQSTGHSHQTPPLATGTPRPTVQASHQPSFASVGPLPESNTLQQQHCPWHVTQAQDSG
jgi:hypothetical protein